MITLESQKSTKTDKGDVVMLKKLRKTHLSILLILLLTLTLVACSTDSSKKTDVEKTSKLDEISTLDLKEKLDDDKWIVVDTRINDAYNGWKLDGVSRGGHIKGAVDFSANWLEVENKNKEDILNDALKSKKIDTEKNIVLYDSNGEDAIKVANFLKSKGFNNLHTYNINEWADDESLPMDKYENYHLIVPASVVKDVIDKKTPETFENSGDVKIVEASWGEEETSYAKGHVPTSFHINTDSIEPPPAWMLADDKVLKEFALSKGFTANDTVILTGEEPLAAYRIALVLRYIGVKDVRVLNGGTSAWTTAGYDLDKESHNPTPVTEFGADIPLNPDIIDTIAEAKQGLTNPDKFTLVDNRTWKERIGEESGYSYHDIKGRIPGSIYGSAGKTDSSSMDYYRNIDNTMRNKDEILNMWDEYGIDTDKHLSFMCGSGWRVAEIQMYSNVMGLEDTSVYSDGWIGWSRDSNNPIETGEPK